MIAIHHVDVPWRASDIEQQNGRAFRQGNMYNEIYEFRYVTKKSFDAYSWQMVETKSSYVTQLLEGTGDTREFEEDTQNSFSYAEVKAIASGNPIIKEKFEVDNEVKRLETMRRSWQKKKLQAQDDVALLPDRIETEKKYRTILAEECEYLVIEDWFPNGRPELEKGGIMFTDRATVDKVEKMKVCTCLNPLHTALAVFGCLLGYTKISDEMKDAELRKMVERIGYTEGLPVVVDPGILDPKEFIDTVLNVRIPNPFMPDTPQRIATDTSQKLAIRFGETVKNYLASEDKDIKNLKLIPLVFAGWMRYLMAVDDNGEKFELSPDPLLETVCPVVAGIRLGDTDVEETIRPLLTNRAIFGVDLYEAGLAGLTVQYFKELIAGVGAVRATLKKYV